MHRACPLSCPHIWKMPPNDLVHRRTTFPISINGLANTFEHWRTLKNSSSCLDVEQEVQHVAILDHVFLAFGAHLARVLCALFTLVLDEVFKRDGLGPDEAALEVAMDHTCGLGSGVAHMDGPGAHFLHARGEVGLQAQQLEAGAKEAGKMRAEGKEYVVKDGDVLNFLFNV